MTFRVMSLVSNNLPILSTETALANALRSVLVSSRKIFVAAEAKQIVLISKRNAWAEVYVRGALQRVYLGVTT